MDNHETARLSFLTMNWEKAPFGRSDYLEFEVLPPKPTKFDEMVKIAKSLSGGHPFLRVDLYEKMCIRDRIKDVCTYGR